MAKATKKATPAKKSTSAKKSAPVKKAVPAKKAAPKKATPSKKAVVSTVAELIQQLDKATAETVEAIRKVFLKTDKEVGEQIKWNSPSFCYTGEMKSFDPKEYKRDIAVMNFNKKEYVLLIFPTGARIKDTSGLLEGTFTDGRRMVKIANVQDLKVKEKALQQVIKEWLKGVER